MAETEAPALGRKPPATATPSTYSHRARRRLYPTLPWAEYFSFGFPGQAEAAIWWHVIQRVRQFLCRRYKLRVSGTSRFGHAEIYGKAGVVDLH